MDNYTRFILTVIAVALSVIALKGVFQPVAPAYAADGVCEVRGPIEVKGTLSISGIRDQIKVKVEDAYGEPGSNSGNPFYVREVN